MVIYMENHPEKAIPHYWRASKDDNGQPIYQFTRHMPLRRFEALFRRLRIFDEKTAINERDDERQGRGYKRQAPKTFTQVTEWSNHIQDVMSRIYSPGTCIAVDECMVGFTGRSKLTTYIANKPTPLGFKVWVVAQDGLFLRWLWHEPGKGPIGMEPKKRKDTSKYHLTPTQRVVIALVNLLPRASYHVFLDNLFSSPDLFKYLYDMGVGASGTARINCGIHEDLVKAKQTADASKPWGWTLEIPTVCNKVSFSPFSLPLI